MVRGRRLGRRLRAGVLVVHIVSAGAWIGIDVVLAVLVFTALLTDEARTAALCFQALELFAIWPLLVAGSVCLASGITLGLGTGYGLVRYWWVAAKLLINIVFVALVPLALRPTVFEASEYGRRLAAGQPVADAVHALGDLIYPPVVSPIGLLIAVLLAVYRPWGRIRGPRGRIRAVRSRGTAGTAPAAGGRAGVPRHRATLDAAATCRPEEAPWPVHDRDPSSRRPSR